jgi:Septum formation
MVLDPELEPEFAEPGFAEPGFAEPGFAGPDFAETDSQPVSKLAVVALVTGLVALVPISVASGVASLIGIRRTGRGGHGMAMAGLFLSAAWVIIAAAVGTVGLLTHGFHKPVVIKYREAAVFALHEGDCVNSPNGQFVSILPCSAPHEAEVFATFALPQARWPGTAAISSEASSGCGSRLDGYLNPQLAVSLSQSFVYPNQVAWTAGTRTVICEVRASSGQLTGSVRGATLTDVYRTGAAQQPPGGPG